MLKSYENKIKCIYIDPPYNTGSDGFVYNDRFTFTKETLAQKLSISEETAERIFAQLNSSERTMDELEMFGLYESGKKVTDKPEILFARLDAKEVPKTALFLLVLMITNRQI